MQPSSQSADILEALANFPAGASLQQIESSIPTPPNRRTLQRRLGTMVADGQLTLTGFGRGARYQLTPQAIPTKPTVEIPEAEAIPFTPTSEALRTKLRGPITTRTPVGYNHQFLDSYRPNVTRYLSLELSHELAELGKFPEGDSPAGTYARQIFNRLLIDLSWNSSRLEGNTYSLLETERLLQLGAQAEGKTARDTQMILNHKAAIELLVEEAGSIAFDRRTVLGLHALLSENLLDDPAATGRLRHSLVGISGTVFHPLGVPQLIEEYFDQILATAEAIRDPFEQSFFAMVHLPYLQPFQDVNKRVSRLAANIPLIKLNFCPLSFIDVPQRDYVDGVLAIYELNRVDVLRDVFVWAYRRSCQRYSAVRQVLGEPDLFRLRYREDLKRVVAEVIRAAMDKAAAAHYISEQASTLPAQDQPRFIEVAETELLSLHEGNFIRYRIRPSEFERWRQNWK